MPHPEDLGVFKVLFVCPDLGVLCRLEELGLEARPGSGGVSLLGRADRV